jgi:hypothetical protein
MIYATNTSHLPNSLIGVIPPMSQKKLIQELLKIDKNLRESVQEVALDWEKFNGKNTVPFMPYPVCPCIKNNLDA